MRWRKRYSRIVKRFALFPIKAKLHLNSDVDEWRWLETVYLYQLKDWKVGFIPFWATLYFVHKQDYNAYISQLEKEKENG